jgi:uncharacterized protein (DUF736 family)
MEHVKPAKREDECGALWQKLNRDGEAFYTGTINGEDVIIFENKFKKSDAHPHFRVYKSQRKTTKPVPSAADEGIPF